MLVHRAIVCPRCPPLAALLNAALAADAAASSVTGRGLCALTLSDPSPVAVRGVLRWLYGATMG